jgi:hypothetical protein
MKITLEGCQHKWVETRSTNARTSTAYGTCTHCYVRVKRRTDVDALAPKQWVPDAPVGPCTHGFDKKPISEVRNKRQDFRDAICMGCGVVLRHPDGPGQWDEVIYNGFIIEEEP